MIRVPRLSTFTRNLFTALLVLAAPGAAVAQQDRPERPFALAGAGQLDFDPRAQPSGPFHAQGHATGMGAWQNQGRIAFAPASQTVLLATGTVTFRAASGATLDATFTGVLDVTTGLAIGEFRFTGGTGRFAGAQGSAQMALVQSPDGSFVFALDGSLTW